MTQRRRVKTTKTMHLNMPPHVHAALMEFAAATDGSAAAFVCQVLEKSLPQIEALTRAAQQAKAAPLAAIATLEKMLDSAQTELSGAQKDMRQMHLLAA